MDGEDPATRLFLSVAHIDIVVVQAEVPNSSQELRSNGSLHRVFACTAGGPGFNSQLRRSRSRMLSAEDVGGPGQAPI
jgi:hypothetical protein